MALFRYGNQQSLKLELAPGLLRAQCDAPRGEPVRDLGAAVDRALAEPLDFPSLAQAAMPLDKVVLALSPGVPQTAMIIECAIRVLTGNGVAAHDITLVHTITSETAAREMLAGVPPHVRKAINLLTHDPLNRDTLSYLAAATDAKPIYVNRAIHDADFVISISEMRPAGSPGYHGVNSCIFPTFSDAASQGRYQSPRASQHSRLARQADEVAWLLGLSFTIQIVPGVGSEILHVLAGDPRSVLQRGTRLCDEAWSFEVPQRASLVVATIEGPDDQTWDSVGRALAAAAATVSAEGAVALCTELAERPGAGLQQVIGADNLDDVLDEVAQHPAADALVAAQLVHALQRGRVYLISRLDDELVEELGMSPLAASRLSAVAARYDSCIVLTNSHRVTVHVQGDAPAHTAMASQKSRS